MAEEDLTIQINIEPINTESSDEEDAQPELQPVPEPEPEPEPQPEPQPEIKRDRKGRRITQKRIESTREAQKKAMEKRALMKKKAELYDQVKVKDIDYDYLTNQLIEKLEKKKQPIIEKPVEKVDIQPAEKFRKPRDFFKW